MRFLRNKRNAPGQRCRRQAGEWGSLKVRISRVPGNDSAENLQEGGLSRPVRTDERKELAGIDSHCDIAKNRFRGVAELKITEIEHRRHGESVLYLKTIRNIE